MSDMESDHSSLTYVFVICGSQKLEANQLTVRSSIEQIHKAVRSLFGSSLPDYYHLMFYSSRQRKFITLNDNIVHSNDNPFQSGTECTNTICDYTELYVVDMSNTQYKCLGKYKFMKNISKIVY